MAPKSSKAPKAQPKPPELEKEYPTISAKLDAEYPPSRPFSANLSTKERNAYVVCKFLESGSWRSWGEKEQKEFWDSVQSLGIKSPVPKPDLTKLGKGGKDINGRELGALSVKEFGDWEVRQREVRELRRDSERFEERRELAGRKGESLSENEVLEERNRRKLLGHLTGKRMGRYEGDPVWDNVVPVAQVDGEGALAQIAYSEEYSEAMGYLRAIMAAQEHTPRVLTLTSHIISLNAAHYTVWLYRAATIFALDSSIEDELQWVNEIALENQKNYQIWHHRQLLIDHLYTSIKDDPEKIQELGEEEVSFMTKMFDEDSKNYHVWSYRQYLVRKLNLFNAAELKSIEILLRKDTRNNSAWSHRFFVVFSDPAHSTPGSKATSHDPLVPDSILDREIEFAKAATFEAPQNQSPWNYLRGVLKKGNRKLASMECFASEFVQFKDESKGKSEDVKSSHALDFLADLYVEEGRTEKAELCLGLLANKYDRIRKNYWEWRRKGMESTAATAVV